MRNKTYKLQKLEKNRFSILTNDMEHCFICKNPFIDIHEIYGGRNRKVSMQNGFCVPLCRERHEFVTLNIITINIILFFKIKLLRVNFNLISILFIIIFNY